MGKVGEDVAMPAPADAVPVHFFRAFSSRTMFMAARSDSLIPLSIWIG